MSKCVLWRSEVLSKFGVYTKKFLISKNCNYDIKGLFLKYYFNVVFVYSYPCYSKINENKRKSTVFCLKNLRNIWLTICISEASAILMNVTIFLQIKNILHSFKEVFKKPRTIIKWTFYILRCTNSKNELCFVKFLVFVIRNHNEYFS